MAESTLPRSGITRSQFCSDPRTLFRRSDRPHGLAFNYAESIELDVTSKERVERSLDFRWNKIGESRERSDIRIERQASIASLIHSRKALSYILREWRSISLNDKDRLFPFAWFLLKAFSCFRTAITYTQWYDDEYNLYFPMI